MGYKCVIGFLSAKADTQLEVQIDSEEYDEADLVEIRVSLNMPYQQRFTEYERHYGEIEIDGQTYTYVKRKIEGDIAIFKCIANTSKQKLKEKENDLAKSNSPVNNTDKKQTHSFKISGGDFDDKSFFDYKLSVSSLLLNHFSMFSSELMDGLSGKPYQPPKSC